MSKYYKAYNTLKNIITGGNKTSPTISSVKIKKNLTGRRTDRDSIIKGVDKHLKSSDQKKNILIKLLLFMTNTKKQILQQWRLKEKLEW